jgi:hypothetical protein
MEGGTQMRRYVSMWLFVGMVITLLGVEVTAQHPPEGQLTIAFTSSITPAFLDLSEPGLTSLIFLYALHDALFKPLPGNLMAPALAESWLFEPMVLHGVGPRVEESAIGLLPLPPPLLYEEMRLRRP